LFVYLHSDTWQPNDRFQIQVTKRQRQTDKIGAGIKLKKERMLSIKIKFC